MLRIVQIEEIENLLLLLPAIVQQQEQRSADFASNVDTWLRSLEDLFTSNRLYQAGSISILRGSIVGAKQGQMPTGIEFRTQPSRSQLLNAVASVAIQRAAEIASNLIAENRPRLSEAERIAQQIIAVALSRGLIVPRDEHVNNTHYLRIVRGNIVTTNDLANVIVHLEGLVGSYDALILIDRALSTHVDITSLLK